MIDEVKKRLRQDLLARRGTLQPDYRTAADAAIMEQLFQLPEYQEARVIYSYYSVAEEVGTRGILRRALADGKTVALPVVVRRGVMRPRRLQSLEELVPGFYGIPVPPETEPYVEEGSIDLILVPGLAFDQGGFRLGYGGGYYDRLLSMSNAYAVGLVREAMLVHELPVEDHDQAVDCLITEKSVARLR